MINLIPREEKKKMTTDFHYRLAILLFVVVDFCLLVVLLCMLPAYFYSSINTSLAYAQLQAQKSEPQPVLGEQSLAAIKDINSKINSIENAERNKFPISMKVINAVLVNKRTDIKITQILYDNGSVTGKKIKITGTASSRETLLLFREALEQSPSFKSVELPISNFVKGSNIEFYLNLIPA